MRRLKHHIKRHLGIHHVNTPKSFLMVFVIITFGVFGVGYSLKAYPEIFRTDITLRKSIDIRPAEPAIIDFSIPVSASFYESKIKIEPAENYKLRWGNSNKKVTIIPENFWKPETLYKIILPEARNAMFSKISSKTLFFRTEKYPRVSKIIPENNAKDVAIDIEDPVIVNFDKSANDFFIRFELDPPNDLSLQNNLNKTQFKLLPKDKIQDNTKYTLKIYAKYIYDPSDNFQKIYQGSFETETKTPILAIGEKDYTLRLEQAKKYTEAKIKTGKYVDINLSSQVLSIFQDGTLMDSFMISSGKRGMETPKGQTRVYNKFPRAFSRPYGLYMPRWMAIAPGGKFGIHELPEWPNGYKEGSAHLGIPVSHGCVRLGVGPAERVYTWAEIGTPVVVY